MKAAAPNANRPTSSFRELVVIAGERTGGRAPGKGFHPRPVAVPPTDRGLWPRSITLMTHRSWAEPWRIKVVEPLVMTSRLQRERAIAEAGFNTFLLRSNDVY